MTWKKSDMKQCHRFLQDTELVPCMHRILENEISGQHMHALKQLKVVSWFHTSIMVQCINQTQGSLASQMPMSLSKEHVIY